MAREIIGRKGVRPASAPGLPAAAGAEPRFAVRHVVVDETGEGQRLDNFLGRMLKGVPKAHVHRMIRSGEVRVNGGRAESQTRLAPGDEVRVPPVRIAEREVPAAHAPAREFPVAHEDELLLVIDKPAGVAVHGGSGVAFGVIEQLRRARPEARFLELVHRLDKETSGLLLIAKKRSALVDLQAQFRRHGADATVAKTYAALVAGSWPSNRKVIDVALHKYLTADGERRVRPVLPSAGPGASGRRPEDHESPGPEAGRRAITLVRVLRDFGGCTLLDVTIKTGRTHQIRVHLAHHGHPIVGDDKYGDFALNKAFARGDGLGAVRFGRMFLHARRLRLVHPADRSTIEFEAPLPAECAALLDTLAAPSAS